MRTPIESRTRHACAAIVGVSLAIASCWAGAVTPKTLLLDGASCRVSEGAISFGKVDLYDRDSWITTGSLRLVCDRLDDSKERQSTLSVYATLLPLTTSAPGTSPLLWSVQDNRGVTLIQGSMQIVEQFLVSTPVRFAPGQKSVTVDAPLRAALAPPNWTTPGNYAGTASLRMVLE